MISKTVGVEAHNVGDWLLKNSATPSQNDETSWVSSKATLKSLHFEERESRGIGSAQVYKRKQFMK